MTTALAHGLKLFLIAPISTISWRCCFTSSKRWGGILLYLSSKGRWSVNFISCFRILHFPRSKSPFEKIPEYSHKRFLQLAADPLTIFLIHPNLIDLISRYYLPPLFYGILFFCGLNFRYHIGQLYLTYNCPRWYSNLFG